MLILINQCLINFEMERGIHVFIQALVSMLCSQAHLVITIWNVPILDSVQLKPKLVVLTKQNKLWCFLIALLTLSSKFTFLHHLVSKLIRDLDAFIFLNTCDHFGVDCVQTDNRNRSDIALGNSHSLFLCSNC